MTKIDGETQIIGALAVLCGVRALILRSQWPPDPRDFVSLYVFAYDNGRDQYVRATVIAAALALVCLGLAIGMTRYRSLDQRPARVLAVLAGLSVIGDLSFASLPAALVMLDLLLAATAIRNAMVVTMRRRARPHP